MRGLSAHELDKMAQVTRGYTSRLESGDRQSPEFAPIVKIARALGVSLDFLAHGKAGR